MGVHVKVAGAWQEITDGGGVNVGNTYVPFTASGSVIVPDGVTEIDVLAVGAGGGGNYGSAGYGAVPAKHTKTVTPGESLTVVVGGSTAVGATGAESSVTGSFGKVAGAGGASGSPAGRGANGTYVPVWGWFGGNGGTSGYVGGYPGGGNGYDLDATGAGGQAVANTGGGGGGAGGGPGAGMGASGFVGIVFKSAPLAVADVPWAKVTGGTVTEYTKPDGAVMEVHTFTANGSLTVVEPGYADVLLVGGGSGNSGASGMAGDILRGLHALPAGAQSVAVGVGADGNDATGRPSSLGSLVTSVSRPALSTDGTVGAGGTMANYQLGYTSSITGAPVVYATANGPATPNSGNGRAGNVGMAGVVIVAVQKLPATAPPAGPSIAGDLLVVGGGGAGGGNYSAGNGGGGGAGAVYASAAGAAALPVNRLIPISVGLGGIATATGNATTSGQASSFDNILAPGGGAGSPGVGAGLPGGCGGGGFSDAAHAGGVSNAVSPSVGFPGGQGAAGGDRIAGGGGGAGEPGNTDGQGFGGDGVTWAVNGQTYGGGGGGGKNNSDLGNGGAGAGGGGRGGDTGTGCGPGTANTGGGGGGAGNIAFVGAGAGGHGGSGIVIARWLTSLAPTYAVSPGLTYTVDTSGGYTKLTFTAGSGSLALTPA